MDINSNMGGGVETITKESINTSHYPMYKVIMHDDDVTPFNFVVQIMVAIYNKEPLEALRTTQEIHDTGSALVGVYMYEHAEMLVEQTHSVARTHKFPLTCSIEKA